MSLVFFCVALSAGAFGADAAKQEPLIKVSHSPKQPKTGDRVVITAVVPTASKSDDLLLQYQVVEPGTYIDLHDPAYAESWTNVAFLKLGGRESEERIALAAELPPELQTNRRLIRYRVWSSETKAVVAPASQDTQRNFAFFVYDGLLNGEVPSSERLRPREGNRAV